ncbi:MAG TPA: pyruvate, phosphate dikinase [Alphaproteobacteria bacterium]
MVDKWVYRFGDGSAEGHAGMRDLLGGKGANLAEMSRLGLPVPPGFTITTAVCGRFYDNERSYPDGLEAEVDAALSRLEQLTGRRFGDAADPLLLSVRSGAAASMPGMMDTVLNLGLNDRTVDGLAARANDPRFAFDSYRRFIQMYGDVVLGVAHHHFEDILESYKDRRGISLDTELCADDWRDVTARYKDVVAKMRGEPFPQDERVQLWGAVGAVFGSWMNQRAVTYRRLHEIPDRWGTAVTVQSMVFGNMGGDCATGVAFTRNPSTGAREVFGEYLINAQGEDVVAGIRTPLPLTRAGRDPGGAGQRSMEETMPEAFAELSGVFEALERHYRDMQDIEFTVQQNRLYMLQTRAGKRTAKAALKIAVDMAEEGLIERAEAIRRVDPASLEQLLHPSLDPDAPRTVLARGLAASPGAATGIMVLSADDAEARAQHGEDVILVRIETSPDDIHGMHAARGILTARGGMTSHAAVVARGMGRPCVAGAGELRIDMRAGTLSAGGVTVRAGERITIDGSTGEVMLGEVATVKPELGPDFERLMGWVDETRTLKVRANAETPADARTARAFGAEGIGLCRTEHMFFEDERIMAIRQVIMADSEDSRRAALARIEPMQRADFVELFQIMAGLPVTVRLLDPPLHEFLPKGEDEIADMAEATGATIDEVTRRASLLHELNPMLGHRGCRLGLSYPEIYEMQARAIFEAVVEVARDADLSVVPEIMIPLAATGRELELLKERIDRVAGEVAAESGIALDYLVGTMIELPRACLCAGELAATAQFFSFGTNDLTQTAFGISRDDSAAFLNTYQQLRILEADPFVRLDVDGVGELIELAVARGRAARPGLKLGICGEHGGDPASIRFCHRVGLDYVSCSPYRVPVARLAAAQAALESSAT